MSGPGHQASELIALIGAQAIEDFEGLLEPSRMYSAYRTFSTLLYRLSDIPPFEMVLTDQQIVELEYWIEDVLHNDAEDRRERFLFIEMFNTAIPILLNVSDDPSYSSDAMYYIISYIVGQAIGFALDASKKNSIDE